MIYANAVLSALLSTSGPYALVPPSFLRPPMAIFSGTVSIGDVLDDIQIQKQRCSDRSHLHTGFANRARRMLAQEDMTNFLKRHNNVVFGGYSLGGAVAVIAAHLAMCESLCTVRGVYTFGAPAVGDDNFVQEYDTMLKERTFRYTLSQDIVPGSNWRFEHVGKHIVLKHEGKSVIDNHQLTRYAEKVVEHFDFDCELISE